MRGVIPIVLHAVLRRSIYLRRDEKEKVWLLMKREPLLSTHDRNLRRSNRGVDGFYNSSVIIT